MILATRKGRIKPTRMHDGCVSYIDEFNALKTEKAHQDGRLKVCTFIDIDYYITLNWMVFEGRLSSIVAIRGDKL